MEEKKRQGGAAGFLSGLAVLAAALLLAQACRTWTAYFTGSGWSRTRRAPFSRHFPR